jgi:pimeloyl-ACP methyl ester carboxylesterase
MKRVHILAGWFVFIAFTLAACTGRAQTSPAPTKESVQSTLELAEGTPGAPDESPYPPPQDPITNLTQDYPPPATGAPLPASPYPYPEQAETTISPAQPLPTSSLCAGNVTVTTDLLIPGADGLQISGDYYQVNSPEPLPMVILLHMYAQERTRWGDFPQYLAENCFQVFNMDLRGHGKTGGEEDWPKAIEDISRVVEALSDRPEVAGDKISLVGASIGANVALNAAANLEQIYTVVLLSPGLEYARVTTLPALAAYGDRPILIVASEEDRYAAESSRNLDSVASGEHQLHMYNNAGHGTDMFASEPELGNLILGWLLAQLP